MSRTDAHTPVPVRLARGELAARAHHALNDLHCTLPEHPRDQLAHDGRWDPVHDCYWSFRYTGINVCSCARCHAGPQHRAENRAERRRAKTDLRVAAARWDGGDCDAFDDLIAPHRLHIW